MTAVVKEAAEGELEECVLRMLAVLQSPLPLALVLLLTVTQLVRIHRVKVGRVGGVADGGDVGRLLLAQGFKVDTGEERVCLDLIGSVDAQAVLRSTAQPLNQVFGRLAQLGVSWDLQLVLPIDYLQQIIDFQY